MKSVIEIFKNTVSSFNASILEFQFFTTLCKKKFSFSGNPGVKKISKIIRNGKVR